MRSLRKTVGIDWRVNMSGSHLQSQVTVENSNEIQSSNALVFIVIGSWKSNVIGSEDGDW